MTGSDVFAKLASHNLNLTAPNGTQKIYPNQVRMGDKLYPQLVFALSDYKADESLDGSPSTASIDLKIAAIGKDYDSAAALSAQVRTALDYSRGQWGSTTVQGAFVTDVAEDHFIDTELQTILYFSSELSLTINFVIS